MSPRILGRGTFFPYDADHKDLRKQFDKNAGGVATIRPYGAKFGKAVAVEPGITNLQTQTHFETILGGWNSTNGHRPADVINLTDGWRRVPKVDFAGVTNGEIFVNSAYAISAGQRYTEQFTFRFDGSRPTFTISFFYGGLHHHITPTITHLGNSIWHAMATHVIESGGTALRAIDLTSLNWGSSSHIDITEPIIHLHAGVQSSLATPIRTSHVWGTRAAGVLKYPGWLLPRSAGTISCWIRPNYDYKAFTGNWHGIICSTTTNGSDQLRLVISNSGVLSIQTFVGAGQQIGLDHTPASWDVTRLYHVAFSWSDVEQVLYLDGQRVNSRQGSFSRWSEAATVEVGMIGVNPDVLDGLIDDVAFFPRQLSDAQIAAIHA